MVIFQFLTCFQRVCPFIFPYFPMVFLINSVARGSLKWLQVEAWHQRSGEWLAAFWDMWKRRGAVEETSGSAEHGRSMEDLWKIYGLYMDHMWFIYGWCMKYLWVSFWLPSGNQSHGWKIPERESTPQVLRTSPTSNGEMAPDVSRIMAPVSLGGPDVVQKSVLFEDIGYHSWILMDSP